MRYLKGDFGDKLWILAKGDEKKKKWEEALRSIPNLFGITVDERRYCLSWSKTRESEFELYIDRIVMTLLSFLFQ